LCILTRLKTRLYDGDFSKPLHFKYYFHKIQRVTDLKDLTCNKVDTKQRSEFPPFGGH
jgi:hypothetical protein